MIHRILLPLDLSNYTDAALEYACYLSKKHNAEITGLVILDVPDIEESIGSVPLGGIYWAEKMEKFKFEQAKQRIKKLLNKFNLKCSKNSIDYKVMEEQGSPSARINQISKYYDLVVMGLRSYYKFDGDEDKGDVFHKILDLSITPILAVPDHYQNIKNVLIAFDGSPVSVKSLKQFTDIASFFDYNIKVVMSSDKEDIANYHLKMARKYLESYKLKNFKTELIHKSIIDAIKTSYLDWADLIVLGAHSKHFIKKFFFGSVTTFLVQKEKKPLFIGI